MKSSYSRNVTLADRRTSIRLEPVFWETLDEICQMEGLSLSALAQKIDRRRDDVGLTSAMRVVALGYCRRLGAHFNGEQRPLSAVLDLLG